MVLKPRAPSVSDGSPWFSVVIVQPADVLATFVTTATSVRPPFCFCLLRPPHMEMMSPAAGSLLAEPDVATPIEYCAPARVTNWPASSSANSVRPVIMYRKRFASSVHWNPA